MRDFKMSTCRRFVVAVDKVALSLADKCAKQGVSSRFSSWRGETELMSWEPVEVLSWNGVCTAMEKAVF